MLKNYTFRKVINNELENSNRKILLKFIEDNKNRIHRLYYGDYSQAGINGILRMLGFMSRGYHNNTMVICSLTCYEEDYPLLKELLDELL